MKITIWLQSGINTCVKLYFIMDNLSISVPRIQCTLRELLRRASELQSDRIKLASPIKRSGQIILNVTSKFIIDCRQPPIPIICNQFTRSHVYLKPHKIFKLCRFNRISMKLTGRKKRSITFNSSIRIFCSFVNIKIRISLNIC